MHRSMPNAYNRYSMAQEKLSENLLNTIQVSTWNVNGLQEGTKKHKVLYHLGKWSSDIVFLQELHFKTGQIEFLKRQWVGEAFEATLSSRSRGVGILINKRLPFKSLSQATDKYGRYLVLRCEILGELYTLINIYKPPISDLSFLNKIQSVLDRVPTGIIILGGDLNNIFSSKDSSTPTRKVKPPNKLLNFLSTNDLQDILRTLHPNTLDYTYFSHSQNSYNHIDYLFISNKHLGMVLSSKINDIVISDHAIVSFTLSRKENVTFNRTWRMNRKYLLDMDFMRCINSNIDLFIEKNVSGTSRQT